MKNKIVSDISEFSHSNLINLSIVTLLVVLAICAAFAMFLRTDLFKRKTNHNGILEKTIEKTAYLNYLINNMAWIFLIILLLIKGVF